MVLAAALAPAAVGDPARTPVPLTFRIVELQTTACEWHGEPAFTCRQLVAPVTVELAFDPAPGRAVRLEADGVLVAGADRPGVIGIGAGMLPPGAHLLSLSLLEQGSVAFTRTFRIDVAPPDMALPPPVVSFASPRSGASLSGVVDVAVRAHNPRSQRRAVDRVDILVDGRPLSSATHEPWEARWDTAAWGRGRHVLTALAVGSGGQVGRADAEVTVLSVRELLPGGAVTSCSSPERRGASPWSFPPPPPASSWRRG
jgi:hypothetical protein